MSSRSTSVRPNSVRTTEVEGEVAVVETTFREVVPLWIVVVVLLAQSPSNPKKTNHKSSFY